MKNQSSVIDGSLSAALGEPAAVLVIVEDDHVLAALEDDVEVAAVDRLLRPPAVEHAPLLPDQLDSEAVDETRRPVCLWLDEGGPRFV
jgi:hypothetical protein